MHGNQWKQRPIAERFWEKVRKGDAGDCWEWTANRHQFGYGMFAVRNVPTTAMRVAWELTYGPIPSGLHVCHHCDNPPCCNPAHLFLGTAKDNLGDAARKGRTQRYNAEKTHCPEGHEYTLENTRICTRRDGRTYRACRECLNARARKAYHAENARARSGLKSTGSTVI